jgi:FkbM family methyltransferase
MYVSPYNPRGLKSGLIKPLVNFPRRLLRDREYRRLNKYFYALKGKQRFTPGELRYDGERLIRYCDAPSFLSAFDEIFVNRIYDDPGLSEDGPLYFIDAGANIGLASLYWSLHYPGCEGVAFEPDGEIFKVLESNLKAWNAAIRPVCAALSSSEGELEFISEGADAGRLADGDSGGAKKVTVRAEKLSTYLDRPVDLLKLDVEGAELEVIREIVPALPIVKRIFVEAHSFCGQPQDYGELIHLLQDSGFRCNVEVASSQWHGLHRLSGSTDMDLNLNIYGTRLA